MQFSQERLRNPRTLSASKSLGLKVSGLGHGENAFRAKLGLFLGLNGALFSILLFMLTVVINAKSAPFGALCFLFPIEDDFAGSPATHSVEAFLEVVHFEVMGDNWR